MTSRQGIRLGSRGPTEGERSVYRGGSAPYFDAVSSDYFQWYHSASPGGYALRVRKQRVLELLDIRGGKVLDVGCGPGIMVQDFINLGYEFWGVDPAAGMIEECHKIFGQMQRAHFCVGNAADLPFPDGFFDTALCMGVIDRIPDYRAAIEEMARVVKKQGTLLITFPNLLSPYAAWKNFVFYPTVAMLQPIYYGLTRRFRPPSLLSSSAKLHTTRSVAALLSRHGAEVTDIVHFNFNVFLSPLDEIFPRWTLRALESLEQLRFGRLKWLGTGFLIKAQKH